MPVKFEVRQPPNRRSRRASKAAKAFPGTADCCPACKSPRLHLHADHGVTFYGRQIALCANLRAEITRLNAELAKKPAAPAADPAVIEAADRHGFERGFRKGFEDAIA